MSKFQLPNKCHNHHHQRWCKIFRAEVNLLLLTYGVFFTLFLVSSSRKCRAIVTSLLCRLQAQTIPMQLHQQAKSTHLAKSS